MNSIRVPFLIAALVLIGLAVLMEAGSGLAISFFGAADKAAAVIDAPSKEPPGIGIASMAMLDGLVLFTGLLLAAPLVISHRNHAKVQGIATLIVGIIVLIGSITMIFFALGKLLMMIGLLLAFPFGTIIYLAEYADFGRPLATAILASIMFCKLGFAVCLVLAHEGILKNVPLILIIATSLLANIVVSFLHSMVPGILVSITDAVAAIVVCILALIWAIFFLVGSIISIIKLAAMAKNAGDALPSG